MMQPHVHKVTSPNVRADVSVLIIVTNTEPPPNEIK